MHDALVDRAPLRIEVVLPAEDVDWIEAAAGGEGLSAVISRLVGKARTAGAPAEPPGAVAEFVEEVLIRSPDVRTPTSEVMAAYLLWAEARGRHSCSQAQLGRRLRALGLQRFKNHGRMVWGAEIRPLEEES